jgi:hypothetical protein
MRYIILVLLNVPIILLALVNFVTRYKLKRIEKTRFHRQIILWTVLLVALISSFPVYNLLNNKELLDSSELSFFDIFQTTAVIFLLYIVNRQRQKNEQLDKNLRDFHQELSIKLSGHKDAQTKH